jgi:hypothetical protein
MKRSSITAVMIVLSVATASAQTTSAPPPQQQAPAQAAAPGKETAKDVRSRCRDEARGQGLRGAEMKAAAWTCFTKTRPDLAAAFACRRQGRGKGLSGDELRSFVRDCKTNKAVLAQPPG